MLGFEVYEVHLNYQACDLRKGDALAAYTKSRKRLIRDFSALGAKVFRDIFSVFLSTDPSSRISDIEAGFGYVFCYDGPGSHHDIITDCDWHNGRIGADADVVPQGGFTPFGAVPTGGASSGEAVVDEHCAVGNEAIFAYCYQLADKGVGLHAGARTHGYTGLNFHEGADENAVTESAVVDICGLDNGYIRTTRHISDDYGLICG
nr:hypothetical protein [Sulfitobacter sp. JL08]